jgi:hypothetical protein
MERARLKMDRSQRIIQRNQVRIQGELIIRATCQARVVTGNPLFAAVDRRICHVSNDTLVQ